MNTKRILFPILILGFLFYGKTLFSMKNIEHEDIDIIPDLKSLDTLLSDFTILKQNSVLESMYSNKNKEKAEKKNLPGLAKLYREKADLLIKKMSAIKTTSKLNFQILFKLSFTSQNIMNEYKNSLIDIAYIDQKIKEEGIKKEETYDFSELISNEVDKEINIEVEEEGEYDEENEKIDRQKKEKFFLPWSRILTFNLRELSKAIFTYEQTIMTTDLFIEQAKMSDEKTLMKLYQEKNKLLNDKIIVLRHIKYEIIKELFKLKTINENSCNEIKTFDMLILEKEDQITFLKNNFKN